MFLFSILVLKDPDENGIELVWPIRLLSLLNNFKPNFQKCFTKEQRRPYQDSILFEDVELASIQFLIIQIDIFFYKYKAILSQIFRTLFQGLF